MINCEHWSTASRQIFFWHYFCFWVSLDLVQNLLIKIKKTVHGPSPWQGVHGPGPRRGSMDPWSMFCPHPIWKGPKTLTTLWPALGNKNQVKILSKKQHTNCTFAIEFKIRTQSNNFMLTVTQSKIKVETITQIKSRIWKMKEDKCANILAKIQVSAVFRRWDILRNVLPRFLELCMETNRDMSLSFTMRANSHHSRPHINWKQHLL